MSEFNEPWHITTEVDSWVTEKFPGAIRIGRDKPPFAFGEDIAAVHPSLPEVADRIVAAVNAMAGIPDPAAFVKRAKALLKAMNEGSVNEINKAHTALAACAQQENKV